MIEIIFSCREQGIGRENLLQKIELQSFSQLRLNQLLRDGMVVADGERLRPTHKGQVVIEFILAYRRLLGRTRTGG